MSKTAIEVPPKGGFSFDLCRRNEMILNKSGVKAPTYRKTGTTIVGLIFEDGVILGADTRATEGPIVADKNCEKIHYMAPNIYCCGAGTAADTEAVTDAKMTGKDHDESNNNLLEEEESEDNDNSEQTRKNWKKKRLLKEAEKADKRGVCYMSRIPPHMDPLKLRQIISQYGEIERIYLAPENPAAQLHRKRAGGFRGQQFKEGWIEFTKKSVAMRVANMLNGEQIGGRKRSSFYYDIWNIKYLRKFKWDDLTAEIAYDNAVREQKSALELAAAKRGVDSYRNQVDKAHQISSKRERLQKKQKVQQDSDVTTVNQQEEMVLRKFQQTQPVTESSSAKKPQLSKDILAGVFSSK